MHRAGLLLENHTEFLLEQTGYFVLSCFLHIGNTVNAQLLIFLISSLTLRIADTHQLNIEDERAIGRDGTASAVAVG